MNKQKEIIYLESTLLYLIIASDNRSFSTFLVIHYSMTVYLYRWP